MEHENNCHGCKWLDESSRGPEGSGYCCMIERSEGEDKHKIRLPGSDRCELYCEGDFETRWDEGM